MQSKAVHKENIGRCSNELKKLKINSNILDSSMILPIHSGIIQKTVMYSKSRCKSRAGRVT